MVESQIAQRGIRNPRVLEAMRRIPRHCFLPERARASAYEDAPVAIGFGATISQPYIVAYMTELLDPQPTDRVLEIGTGSGYQAAILSGLVREVIGVEIVPELAARAAATLKELSLTNVRVETADGYQGWAPNAPYDKIIVTAAPPDVPPALIAQLKNGGRLVAPVGPTSEDQMLVIIEKDVNGRVSRRPSLPVRFVPLVKGRARN